MSSSSHVLPPVTGRRLLTAVTCHRCEKGVMSSVNVRNCIRFYQTAEELNAGTLMNYCGEIIASHWVRASSTTPHPPPACCAFLWLFRSLLQIRFTV